MARLDIQRANVSPTVARPVIGDLQGDLGATAYGGAFRSLGAMAQNLAVQYADTELTTAKMQAAERMSEIDYGDDPTTYAANYDSAWQEVQSFIPKGSLATNAYRDYLANMSPRWYADLQDKITTTTVNRRLDTNLHLRTRAIETGDPEAFADYARDTHKAVLTGAMDATTARVSLESARKQVADKAKENSIAAFDEYLLSLSPEERVAAVQNKDIREAYGMTPDEAVSRMQAMDKVTAAEKTIADEKQRIAHDDLVQKLTDGAINQEEGIVENLRQAGDTITANEYNALLRIATKRYSDTLDPKAYVAARSLVSARETIGQSTAISRLTLLMPKLTEPVAKELLANVTDPIPDSLKTPEGYVGVKQLDAMYSLMLQEAGKDPEKRADATLAHFDAEHRWRKWLFANANKNRDEINAELAKVIKSTVKEGFFKQLIGFGSTTVGPAKVPTTVLPPKTYQEFEDAVKSIARTKGDEAAKSYYERWKYLAESLE